MSDNVLIQNGMMFCGGQDEKGPFVRTGRMTRTVLAIMYLDDEGHWMPYHMYNDCLPKTKKKATKRAKRLRRKYITRFKVEEIWETVPLEEMEKQYYETTEQIAEEIIRAGIGRVELGLDPGAGRGRNWRLGPSDVREGQNTEDNSEALGPRRGEPSVGEEGPRRETSALDTDEVQHGGSESE